MSVWKVHREEYLREIIEVRKCVCPLLLCCLGHGVELTPASVTCAHLAAKVKECSAACCMCGDGVPFSIWDRLAKEDVQRGKCHVARENIYSPSVGWLLLSRVERGVNPGDMKVFRPGIIPFVCSSRLGRWSASARQWSALLSARQ